MRVSWVEKDMLSLQQDVARRQLVGRNWPSWMSATQRDDCIRALCETYDVPHSDRDVQIATPTYTTYDKATDPTKGSKGRVPRLVR